MKLGVKAGLLGIVFILTIQSHVLAGGTVTSCDEASLRAALAGGGTVTFACDGMIVLANTLVIANNTVLDASGHSITLSGGGSVRVLTVGANLTLKHLTVADGYLVNGNGAGLYNTGNTIVIDCTFSNNATVNPSGPPGFGGAIAHNGGSLIISGSTFVGNRSDSAAAAISVNMPVAGTASEFAVTNSTFFGNHAVLPDSGTIDINPPVPASWIVNCTFAWNTNGGIGVASGYSSDHQLTLINTIVAHSVGAGDCSASTFGNGIPVPLRDGGHNIVSDSSAMMTNVTSLRNTDPLLGPLTNNGGATWTVALQTGSPAIDHADNDAAPEIDQRGFWRPYGSASDIGAFEWAPPFVICGRVSGATLTNEVSIMVDGATLSTTNGWFLFVGQTAGTHAVTPSHSAYLFMPASRSVAVGPDLLNVDFKAYRWNTLSLESATGGVLHLAFASTNDQQYRMLASSNLTGWFSVSTNTTGTSNFFEFFDPAMMSNRTLFYRTASP
jgi:hypothetical protein